MTHREPTPALRRPRGRPSRSRVFTIGALVAVIAVIGSYFALRAYIYGDDAPSIPVIGELDG